MIMRRQIKLFEYVSRRLAVSTAHNQPHKFYKIPFLQNHKEFQTRRIHISGCTWNADDTKTTISSPPSKPEKEKEQLKENQIGTKQKQPQQTAKSKAKRKRQMRLSMSNWPVDGTSRQQVNCIPLADSLDLEALQNNDVFTSQFCINHENVPPEANDIAIYCQCVDDKTSQSRKIEEKKIDSHAQQPIIKEFYVFLDGVVVFWNIESYKQEHVIDHLKRYRIKAFNEGISRSEQETMYIEYTKNQSHASDDTIFLNAEHHNEQHPELLRPYDRRSLPELERFAFSHAMAASVRMGVWEEDLDKLNDELQPCIDKLEVGKLKWNTRKSGRMIGKIAKIRHSVNSTDLLEKDIYWDLSELERAYNVLSRRLKLQSRQKELNTRIDYSESFIKTMHEVLEQKHSHRLEWIIIFLIAVEVIYHLPSYHKLLTSLWNLTFGRKKEKNVNTGASTQ